MRPVVIVLLVTVALAAVVWYAQPAWLGVFYPHGRAVALFQEQEGLSVTGEYPAFGRSGIDASIRTLVFERVVQPALAELAGHEPVPGGKDAYTVSYEVPYRTLRTAGVVLHVTVKTGDFQGAYVIVRTYDLLKDRVVGIDEIAVPTRDPVQVALATVTSHIRGRDDIDPALILKLKPVAATFENLLVRSDGLEFFFNLGHIAPRERGIIRVVIPWNEAGELRRPY